MLKPGSLLHTTLERVGYRVEPGCQCMQTVHWLDQLGWRVLRKRNALIRVRAVMFGEARRRGIIPPGTPMGWRWLVYYGIRDRLAAGWRAVKQASKGHADGTRHHRGDCPRAGRLLPADSKPQDAQQPVK